MSEWISVDERLPELYAPVACIALSAYKNESFVTAGVLHELGFFVFNEEGEPDAEMREVTHWQPLPEPPQ